MEGIKLIYFDLDNTLWDFKKNSYITLAELYEQIIKKYDTNNFGCERFIGIFEGHNALLWEDYRNGRVKKEILKVIRFRKALWDMGIDDDNLAQELAAEYVTRTPLKPYKVDNAVEILEYLYGKYELGIITNGFCEAQYVKLESSGLKKYFEHITVSEDAGATKPDGRIFEYALSKTCFNKDEVVFIGDEYDVDILGAYNAGIKGIWFNRHGEKVENRYESAEIRDLMELKNIL